MQSEYPEFDKLYTELSRPLLAHAYGFCCDWQISEDITQKTWLRVYRYISKRGEQPDTPYIYRMNKDSAYDYLRKLQRTINTKSIEDTPILPAVTLPLTNENEADLFQEFWKQFSELGLPLIDRQIFWLAERNDLTMVEIQARTGIPKSTANDKLRRLKKTCLEFLNSKIQQAPKEAETETSNY